MVSRKVKTFRTSGGIAESSWFDVEKGIAGDPEGALKTNSMTQSRGDQK